jgi:N-acetylneuraminate synthase
MKPFLIAEIGINHNGDVELAKQMIDMAMDTGWDAVKFQKRNVDKVIPRDMWDKPKWIPTGEIPYIEYKRSLELSKKDYDEIDAYCHKRIPWFASAWDPDSIEFLDQYNLRYNKISSPMLTNKCIVEKIAKKKRITFISTGMSKWEDIDFAVDTFRENSCQFILMHCVGLYPCPVDKLNLSMITTLKERYPNDNIGYSGHSPGAIDAIAAAALGANYIEKHITLNRAMFGSDQAASVERRGMEYIRENCDDMIYMLGSGKRYISKEEQAVADKLRYW